jgi:hypothetical protein
VPPPRALLLAAHAQIERVISFAAAGGCSSSHEAWVLHAAGVTTQRFNLLPSLAQDLQFRRDRATVSHDGFSCPPTAVKRLSLCGACARAHLLRRLGACAPSNRPPSAAAEIPAVTHAPLLRMAQLAAH